MPSALDHIQHVRAAADMGTPIPRATIEWLAAGFLAIQLDPRRRLETALRITSRGGIGGMSNQQRQDIRDRMLQEMHTRFYPGLEPRPAARAILNLRDAMGRATCEPTDDAAILLDTVLRLGRLPGERHLARILG